MKKRKKRHSGVGSIYVLIALMIVTAVFTGGILGWLIWYGISGGVSKPRETEAPPTEASTQQGTADQGDDEELLPNSEIPGANQQLMLIPNGDMVVMHEGNMGFTMEAPGNWQERVVSRYVDELNATSLVFYEKANMTQEGADEQQGVLFTLVEYKTTEAAVPEGDNIRVLREADPLENITAVVAVIPQEPVYAQELSEPYLAMENQVENVLATFAWEDKGEDIPYELSEGVTITLPYYWEGRFEAERVENEALMDGVTATVYQFYETENRAAGGGLLMRLAVHEADQDVSALEGYEGEAAQIPANGETPALTVSWFSQEGQYPEGDDDLAYAYLYLSTSLPWILEHGITVEEPPEETTEVPTTPAPTPAPTAPPPAAPPETEPPATEPSTPQQTTAPETAPEVPEATEPSVPPETDPQQTPAETAPAETEPSSPEA